MGRTACTEPQCLYKGALYQYIRLRYDLVSNEVTLIKTRNSAASTRFKTRHGSAAVWVISRRAGKTSNISIRAPPLGPTLHRYDTMWYDPFLPSRSSPWYFSSWRLLYSGMWRRVFSYTGTNISKAILRPVSGQNSLNPWRWRQYVPPKQCYPFIRLHGVTYRKAVILLFATARTKT